MTNKNWEIMHTDLVEIFKYFKPPQHYKANMPFV